MASEIIMPQLGLTMTEGTVGKWKKQVGDTVAVGDALVEIMTDKITSEVESPEAGVLRVICAEEGAEVPVKGLLAIIGTADEAISAPGAAPAAAAGAVAAPAAPKEIKASPAAKRMAAEKGIELSLVVGTGPDGRIQASDVEKYLKNPPPAPATVSADGRIKASPYAKKIAEELGVNLATVVATGPEGRIVEEDVRKAAANPPAAPAPAAAAAVPAKAAAGQPLKGMRKIIAERMTASKHTAPHVTIFMDICVDATIAFRKELNKREEGVRYSYTDLLVKMAATALRRFPAINSSLIEGNVITHEDVNVGIAVALDDGLMVPVLKQADAKGLKAIHNTAQELVSQTRSNQLSMDALQGGTFTISNLGGYDVEGFTPVINQPEAAILGVGAIIKKPVVVKDEIVIASMMTLSLSFDHRLVDGALAAQFLQCIKGYLEDPMGMLL
ncbi:dihydrolipoamide acetyltransferase family protein [uncultured Anaeromusa sp.]|uniref:dihydrolipoamide acetyltransferase family protein n=1 Tax=uncultured Anaeromusa sp. TaxID=673273 RepID=UPI0029C84D3D|nr:dihydrolipoamide acetyltransferase family protein [uncultured Anaeromusa sp.]